MWHSRFSLNTTKHSSTELLHKINTTQKHNMSKENRSPENNNNGSQSETSMNNNNNNNNNWSRVCDTCRSAACKVYCHADLAYLCYNCDTTIHSANRVASRHERVLVCEACESAPALFLCKADSASLCSSCDSHIHSANLLASRHQRFPLLPFTGSLQHHHHNHDNHHHHHHHHHGVCEVEEENDEDEADDEVASWLLTNPLKSNEEDGFFDEYLGFMDCNSCGGGGGGGGDDVNCQHNYRIVPQKNDVVVPAQCGGGEDGYLQQQFQLDFESSKALFSHDGSLGQSVSVSSMDNMVVVLDSTISDISTSNSKSWIGTNELFPPIPMPSHLITPMDREAKVQRYREKKKTRKFEKKIRYVSRKAYAENRPRIKGRFAKRTNVEGIQVDHMHSTTLITEAECSIVPSF